MPDDFRSSDFRRVEEGLSAMGRFLDRGWLSFLATLGVLVILYAVGGALLPGFFSLRAVVTLLRNNAYLGIVALGMTFVILSGGIDLSVGSMLGFATIFIAAATSRWGLHPLAAWGGALALGAAFGAAMGLLIHFYRLPPFLVTLAGMFFARGMAFVVEKMSLGIDHPFLGAVASWGIALDARGVALTAPVLVFFALLGAAIFLTHLTRFGRNVYAVGGDENSARLMGLPVASTKVRVYALSGFCAALAGVVSTIDTPSGDPARGVGVELYAIAAVVIGGTMLTGGVGHVAGTLLGVLILGAIDMTIDFHGRLSSSLQPVAVGLLLLLFILLQRAIVSLAERRGEAGG
jgi:simple sugar transport system permease protein